MPRMISVRWFLLLAALLHGLGGHARAGIDDPLAWGTLPSLPGTQGYAAMYAGVSNGTLIAMGGANFPDAPFWEGGSKVWHDTIHLLPPGASEWTRAAETLPRPMAYGVSASHDGWVYLAGGGDSERHYEDVWRYTHTGSGLRREVLPSLPVPLAHHTGAIVDGILYIAGGQEDPSSTEASSRFLALDLGALPGSDWVELPTWPGPPRHEAVAGAMNGTFYLFGGSALTAGEGGAPERVEPYLRDAYRYTPGPEGLLPGSWERLADPPEALIAAPSPAPSVGMEHLLLLGGVREVDVEHDDWSVHPGFTRDVYAYHGASDSWVKLSTLPDGLTPVVAAPSVRMGSRWYVVSGESRPGVRTNQILSLTQSIGFGGLNWAVLIVYMAGMLFIGYACSRRNDTTGEFFLGGRRMPWWAVGLSIYGTQLSGITFVATAEYTFDLDWSISIGSILIVAVAPIVIWCYLPFFRRLQLVTAYEYLERRFHVSLRYLASLNFLAFHFARMGIVLFIPTVALAAVTGMDIYLTIMAMGIFCIVYTVLGGIAAVIWTDVLQVFVLMGGAFLCLYFVTAGVEGGMGEVLTVAWEEGKLRVLHWGWSPSEAVVWVMVVGFFFLNLAPYTTDQAVIQRYLTTKDEGSAARSLWTNALLTLPGIPIFVGLGTVLYVYYSVNAGSVPSGNSREILPWFIVHQLPAGIGGLVIAGLFAATMSTLDSSMNSMSTAWMNDFQRKLFRRRSDRRDLVMAKVLTVFFGLIGTGVALALAAADVGALFEVFQIVLGFLAGSITGLFLLAIFTRRANWQGALIGTIIGTLVPVYFHNATSVHPFLFCAIGAVSTLVIGYCISPLFPPPPAASVDGLTIHTLRRKGGAAPPDSTTEGAEP